MLYVQNFTDIDDKIIHRANELDGDWKALVDQNIEAYFEDMDALNILRADEYPRCTDYVDDMIRITQDLIDKGHLRMKPTTACTFTWSRLPKSTVN